jgi:hypothetical protein
MEAPRGSFSGLEFNEKKFLERNTNGIRLRADVFVLQHLLGSTRDTINRSVLDEYADFDPRAWTKAPTT